ncbi:uncharacterized protein LOC122515906 [Polistes fuscatus]|uniref:uncharacterized protein LOC122515906 n=1 Tax=Polistes fuscatus TaxID=30207 RepID=UPI001CA98743|nr:uncharacterized protein LOC122515906 [Polistes fuscatus]
MSSSIVTKNENNPNDSTKIDSKVKSKFDTLATEFQYYGAAIRNLAPAMSRVEDKSRIIPWVDKLFAAEYHVEILRDKRNRYLSSLTMNMLNDELSGVFVEDPPIGSLKDLSNETVIKAPLAEWELDTTWSEYVASLPDDYEEIPCSFHDENSFCEQDTFEMDEQMDNEFWFLLYQIRPYAASIPSPNARTIVTAWIQTLCRLSCNKCSKMKGLRNDYAYALYGYVRDLRIAGPFQDYPPMKYLDSLPEAARRAAKKYPLTSPFSQEADSFIMEQPTTEEGAFCYIAVTGDVIKTNAK